MSELGPLPAMLPHFVRPDNELGFQPGQMWLLRQAPKPGHIKFVDKRYQLSLHEPFVFLISDVRVVGYMLPTPRSEQVKVLNLTILTLDGRSARLIIDESEWSFDGWLYV